MTKTRRTRSGARVNGAAIRVIRQRSEMSIADVIAHLAGQGINIHPDYLRNIELGNRPNPSPAVVGGLARALAVPKRAILADLDDELVEVA